LALLFGSIVGFSLGLTGGGGSIFALPLLVYGLGLPTHEAVALSLLAVTLAAAIGALGALRARMVDFRVGLIFAAGGMVAAPLGTRLAARIPDTLLLPAFAVLMLAVALSMWRRATRDPDASSVTRANFEPRVDPGQGPVCRMHPDQRLVLTAPCSAVLAITGLATGILSGLFGVGGGFVIVPALTYVTQITIHRAVATSLLVISLIGASGIVAFIADGQTISSQVAGWFIGGALIGMFAGRRLGARIAGPRLQKLFAAAMLVVALLMLGARWFRG